VNQSDMQLFPLLGQNHLLEDGGGEAVLETTLLSEIRCRLTAMDSVITVTRASAPLSASLRYLVLLGKPATNSLGIRGRTALSKMTLLEGNIGPLLEPC
jgi:hypothetical protein